MQLKVVLSKISVLCSLATPMIKIVIASKQCRIGDVGDDIGLMADTPFTLAGPEKNSTSLPLTLSGGHPWDQSLLGDGKCLTDCAPRFKSCP